MATPPRISNIKAGLMISVALVIEGIQSLFGILHFIPGIGSAVAIIFTTIISFCAYLTFWLWFALQGIFPLKRPRGMALFALTLLIETIPFVKYLPALSFWVFRVIALQRIRQKQPVQKNPRKAIHRYARKKIRERQQST